MEAVGKLQGGTARVWLLSTMTPQSIAIAIEIGFTWYVVFMPVFSTRSANSTV